MTDVPSVRFHGISTYELGLLPVSSPHSLGFPQTPIAGDSRASALALNALLKLGSQSRGPSQWRALGTLVSLGNHLTQEQALTTLRLLGSMLQSPPQHLRMRALGGIYDLRNFLPPSGYDEAGIWIRKAWQGQDFYVFHKALINYEWMAHRFSSREKIRGALNLIEFAAHPDADFRHKAISLLELLTHFIDPLAQAEYCQGLRARFADPRDLARLEAFEQYRQVIRRADPTLALREFSELEKLWQRPEASLRRYGVELIRELAKHFPERLAKLAPRLRELFSDPIPGIRRLALETYADWIPALDRQELRQARVQIGNIRQDDHFLVRAAGLQLLRALHRKLLWQPPNLKPRLKPSSPEDEWPLQRRVP